MIDKDYSLGFLVQFPELLDAAEIPPGFFQTDNQQKVFAAVCELRAAGQPIALITVSEKLSGDGFLTYLSQITEGLFRIKPGDFRRRILTERAADVKREMQHLAQANFPDLDEIAVLAEEARQLEAKAEGEFASSGLPALPSGAELQALDMNVEWTVSRLLPTRSLTLLHGPAGVGKTWLSLCLAKAVSLGEPFLGLETRQRPAYYIDLENPLPLLIDRLRRLSIQDVRFWHLSADPCPPKLDSADWKRYKALPAGSLIVFDTVRAAHDGDENSSQDAGLVMGRLKQIRERGNDVLLLHHTGKVDERIYKGSTAWIDLADHVLAFHKVKRETLEELDEGGFDPHALLSLGTGSKTRYEPCRFFLQFDLEAGGFVVARDPKAETLDAIAAHIAAEGMGLNQLQLSAWAKTELEGVSRSQLQLLLSRGEREGRWRSYKGVKGARIYERA